VRLIGVQMSGLQDVRAPVQEDLFGSDGTPAPDARSIDARVPLNTLRGRLERATDGIDRLRKKYGRQTVVPASLLGRGHLRGRDGSDGNRKPPKL
jgi:hypothetical protein